MNDQEAEIIARNQTPDFEKWYIQDKGDYHNITEIKTVLSNLNQS